MVLIGLGFSNDPRLADTYETLPGSKGSKRNRLSYPTFYQDSYRSITIMCNFSRFFFNEENRTGHLSHDIFLDATEEEMLQSPYSASSRRIE